MDWIGLDWIGVGQLQPFQIGINTEISGTRKIRKYRFIDMDTKNIIGLLNKKATEPSKENAKIVKQFVDGLTKVLMCEEGLLKKSSVMHCGSSYEGLVVKAKSDFDLPLVLANPFIGKNFQILRDERTGYFQL